MTPLSWTEYPWRRHRAVDDFGRRAVADTAVNDQVCIKCNSLGCSRRCFPAPVRRSTDERLTECGDECLQPRMCRNAQCDRFIPSLRKDNQRCTTGPALRCKFARAFTEYSKSLSHQRIRHEPREGLIGQTPFALRDSRSNPLICRITANSIDGVGGKDEYLAPAQYAERLIPRGVRIIFTIQDLRHFSNDVIAIASLSGSCRINCSSLLMRSCAISVAA